MIEIRHCTKSYGSNKTIFEDVDLSIPDGQMTAIVGESGAGKTTLLNIIGLLDNQYQGEYRLDGIDCRNINGFQAAKIRNQRIGFIFQSYHLLPYLSVSENIKLPLLYSKQKLSSIDSLLRDFRLWELKDQTAITLSGGEKQRVAIARAIVNRPKLIIADEPTGNLDNTNSDIVMKILKQLQAEAMTIVIVTHDRSIASQCEKIYKIEQAKLSFVK